jgi:hypothetical protein
MTNSSQAFIEYASQFVITDISKFTILVGICAIMLGVVLWITRKK